jgi:beta-mannanase
MKVTSIRSLTLAAATAGSLMLASPAQAASFQLGVFPNETGGIAAVEQAAGARAAVDHHYIPWTFHSWPKKTTDDFAKGRTPLLSWSAAPKTTASAIASGSQDAVIRAAATALRGTHTVYLRPFYEFDQPKGHPRYIGTSTQVVAAWKHTYQVFRSAGATNVKFVWCPMAFDYAKGVAQRFWPGPSYVDYVAADGYNFPNRSKWRAFGDIFASALAFATQQAKPFIVAETASPGNDPRTASWITQAETWAASHPSVAAIVYFDSISPKGYDFRLLAHPGTFSAYRTWLQAIVP